MPINFEIQRPKAVPTTRTIGTIESPEIIEKDGKDGINGNASRYTIYGTRIAFKIPVKLTQQNAIVFVTDDRVDFSDRLNLAVSIWYERENDKVQPQQSQIKPETQASQVSDGSLAAANASGSGTSVKPKTKGGSTTGSATASSTNAMNAVNAIGDRAENLDVESATTATTTSTAGSEGDIEIVEDTGGAIGTSSEISASNDGSTSGAGSKAIEIPVKIGEVLEDGKWRLTLEKPESGDPIVDTSARTYLKFAGIFRVGGLLEEFVSIQTGLRVNVFKLDFTADKQEIFQAKGSLLSSYDIPLAAILNSIGIPQTNENELVLNDG